MKKAKNDTCQKLCGLIEHTSLKPDLTEEDIIRLCDQAIEFGFFGVCLNPAHIATAVTHSICTDLNVISVAGFPTGAGGTKSKIEETFFAVSSGANEVDVVMDIRAAKEGRFNDIKSEIETIIGELDQNIVIKVIIETGLLDKRELHEASKAAVDAGAEFVKTSTGFWTPPVTPEEVALLKQAVGSAAGIKAAGGIRDIQTIEALVDAGASRIGTSRAVEIFGSTPS